MPNFGLGLFVGLYLKILHLIIALSQNLARRCLASKIVIETSVRKTLRDAASNLTHETILDIALPIDLL